MWSGSPRDFVRELSFSPSGRHVILSVDAPTPDASVERGTDLLIYALPSGDLVSRKRIDGSVTAAFVADDSTIAITVGDCRAFRYCRD
jgi:hypothetical protein